MENANENSSVRKVNEDDDVDAFLSHQLSDLNKLLAISEEVTVDRANEHIVQTKESLRKVEQQSNATPPSLPANDDENAESYVKIPVQQLINTFEKQMRSIITQKVNENVQLDSNGNIAIVPTTEAKPNGTFTTTTTISAEANNNDDDCDDRNKSAKVESNQETGSNIRIDSQQFKRFEQCDQNVVSATSTQQSHEFDIVDTSATATNYNQEFSLAANNVSTYSQFTNTNYAYGSRSSTTDAAITATTIDTLDAILDQNNLQRGKQICMHFNSTHVSLYLP